MSEKFDFSQRVFTIDVKWDGIPDSPNEVRIKEKVRDYVLLQMKSGLEGDDLQRLFNNLKTLLEIQDIEKLNLEQEFEKAKWKVISSTQIETKTIKTEREQSQKEKILANVDLSEVSYIDVEQDVKTWEYKVSQTDALDSYDRQELARLINILKDPRTEEKIRLAKMNPLDIWNLSPKELLVLNTISQMNSDERYHNVLASNETVSILWGRSDVSTTGGIITPDTSFKEKYSSLVNNLTAILKWWADIIGTFESLIRNFKSETNKEKENKLRGIKEKWYEIVKQIQDEKTGFSMTVMKNINEQWKERYTFAIRWTNEWKDVSWSDIDIWRKRLPEQTISLIRTLNKDDDIKKILDNRDNEIEITGHSLWWNLAQIMTALYPDRIKQTYSFNWPWVKNLWPIDKDELATLSKEDKELYELVLKAQQRFFENIHNPKYSFTNIMNVVNKDTIGNMGTHLWLKTAEFWTHSHFLGDLRNNIEKLSEAEFRRVFNFLFIRENQKY
ncbi:MAG: hypothetical protein ACD_71C00124G0011 [uncultured bacterium (gcode 4)]|uniref:Uncharacterized protein n=1 Tax=uncultured bacterium (gcode 4) TaxID=1234023 RepID=K2A383_9BACT|nr:MAG: hypothetical protein ACD_71C00124G0011 [uncultured bacterium (gcode 4)]